MLQSIVDKTIEYLGVPAVVGHEQFFMDLLERDFNALGLSIYRHDRYLVVSGKEPLSAIVCAHIDRHGLISIGDDEYVYAAQYMKEVKYGENNRLAVQQLEGIAKRFSGEEIFAYDDKNGKRLGEGVIEVCNTCMMNGDSLFYVQGMETMPSGVPLSYARTASYEGGYLRGQIDNVISLGVVHELFKQGFQGTAILATEEEIGKSWIHICAYLEQENIQTSNLLVLDTSPYLDHGVIDDGHVVFRGRDMSGVFNQSLVQLLKDRAEDHGLKYEMKDEAMLKAGKTVEQLGSTELGRVVKHFEGRWNGATIQIPTLMYHTSNETTTDKAIENYFTFLRSILIEDRIQSMSAHVESS